MKNPILILCFIALTSAIHAQNPRIETVGDRQMHIYSFQKGGDSIRFTIRGKNDTLQTTKFYRNSKMSYIIWKRDSSYSFDELGRLKTIYYDLNEHHEDKENERTFYANGQLREFKSFKNGLRFGAVFSKTGQLLWQNAPFLQKIIPTNGGKTATACLRVPIERIRSQKTTKRRRFQTIRLFLLTDARLKFVKS